MTKADIASLVAEKGLTKKQAMELRPAEVTSVLKKEIESYKGETTMQSSPRAARCR